MNKIANVVYSGWMVKSPPEQKFRLKGAWKIFRAFSQDVMDKTRWKRRFFVLFKPGGSLPHQYVLNYYSDENCRKLKGYIDLEHCEQIIESLDLDLYPFLLAIKTYHKSKERTYFLATDTEDQMTTWVRNLCSVCGLKPEDNPSEIPPDRFVSPTAETPSPVVHPHTTNRTSVPPVIVQPRPNVATVRKGPDGEAYTALSDCYSGKSSPPLRQDSVDSIPDEPAPPPPTIPGKLGPNTDLDNEVFHPSTYDTPKSREVDSVYKVPPPRNINNSFGETEPYDIPPPRPSPSTPRSSSSESQKADSAYSSQSGLTYDYPPNHGPVTDDTYDIPPSNPQPLHGLGDVPPPPCRPEMPPARPPKPNLSPQEPYQNLPPTSKVFNDSGNCIDLNKVVPATGSDMVGRMSYDVPRPCTKTYNLPNPVTNGKTSDNNLLVTAVPPPPKCVPPPVQHNYINAAKGYVPRKSESDDNYLPMDGTDTAYQDMSGREREQYTDMSSGPQGVYDTPPARPPPVSSRVSPKPSTDVDDDTCTIFSTSRTRSFKRNPSGSPATPKRRAVNESRKVELPSRSHINNHPDISSSSDDEENYLVDPSQVMMPFYMHQYTSQQHSKGEYVWAATPPAPKNPDELKYIDLALENENEKQLPPKPSQNNSCSSPHTEYKEIDFIKTEALKTVKKDIAEQRKQEDP